MDYTGEEDVLFREILCLYRLCMWSYTVIYEFSSVYVVVNCGLPMLAAPYSVHVDRDPCVEVSNGELDKKFQRTGPCYLRMPLTLLPPSCTPPSSIHIFSNAYVANEWCKRGKGEGEDRNVGYKELMPRNIPQSINI